MIGNFIYNLFLNNYHGIFLFVELKPVYNVILLVLMVGLIILIFRVSNLIHALIMRQQPRFNRSSEKYKFVLFKKMKSAKLEPKNEQE